MDARQQVDGFPHHYKFVVDDLCGEVVLRKLDRNLASFHGDESLQVKHSEVKSPPTQTPTSCVRATAEQPALCCLLPTHRELDVLHRLQLTNLANLKLIAPRPIWNGLGPREVVSILHHLRYHLVVCLGTEEPCDRQAGSQSGGLTTNITGGEDLKTRSLAGPQDKQRTDGFQKLLVVLLALQLVLPAEIHDGDRGATESTEKTSGKKKKKAGVA